jgi:transcriptional regulator with XRE-family HTH domain
MDYTVLYIFLAIVIAVGITIVVKKLREKGKLSQEDLLMAINLLNLSKRVVSELRLDKEEQLLTISGLVIDGLEYAASNFDETQDILENAYAFALEISVVLGVDLDENRKALLRDLIVIVFNATYKPEIEEVEGIKLETGVEIKEVEVELIVAETEE